MLCSRVIANPRCLSCCVGSEPPASHGAAQLDYLKIGSVMWVGAYLVGGLLFAATAATLPPPEEEAPQVTTEPEPTGSGKFGDKCTSTEECGFRGSRCENGACSCRPELPATNHFDKCGVEVEINGTCFFHEQCEMRVQQTECKDNRCSCRFEMKPALNKQNQIECIADNVPWEPERYVDPTMIGVLVGMALMFVIICVVLRLFSKARWRDNRTIFNTPNPRLMNVSLLRDTKAGSGERRGSRGSNTKPPSRQPSLASLRPTSPSQSHGSRVSSRGSLRGSRSSSGSARSPSRHQKDDLSPNRRYPQQQDTAAYTNKPSASVCLWHFLFVLLILLVQASDMRIHKILFNTTYFATFLSYIRNHLWVFF